VDSAHSARAEAEAASLAARAKLSEASRALAKALREAEKPPPRAPQPNRAPASAPAALVVETPPQASQPTRAGAPAAAIATAVGAAAVAPATTAAAGPVAETPSQVPHVESQSAVGADQAPPFIAPLRLARAKVPSRALYGGMAVGGVAAGGLMLLAVVSHSHDAAQVGPSPTALAAVGPHSAPSGLNAAAKPGWGAPAPGANAPPEAVDGQPAQSLVDTSWKGRQLFSDGTQTPISLTFEPNGEMRFSSVAQGLQGTAAVERGTHWSQDGGSVRWSLHDGFAQFTGTVTGHKAVGTFITVANRSGAFVVYQTEAGSAAPIPTLVAVIHRRQRFEAGIVGDETVARGADLEDERPPASRDSNALHRARDAFGVAARFFGGGSNAPSSTSDRGRQSDHHKSSPFGHLFQ
jgi:hypothetical protein